MGFFVSNPPRSSVTLLQSDIVTSSQAAITLLNWDSSYDAIQVVGKGMLPVTSGANLLMTFSEDGGSTYTAGTSYQEGEFEIATGGTSNLESNTSAITIASSCHATNAGFFTALILNPSLTTDFKLIELWSHFLIAAGGHQIIVGGDEYARNQAINGIKLAYSSGNHAAAKVYWHGIKDNP